MATQQDIDRITQNFAIAAGATGIPGIMFPGVDLTGIAGLWAGMIGKLASEADMELSGTSIAKFVGAVLGGAGAYLGGSKILTSALSWTGIGLIPAASLNAALNYIYTDRLGQAVWREFNKADFDRHSWNELAVSMAQIVFAMPGFREIKDALRSI